MKVCEDICSFILFLLLYLSTSAFEIPPGPHDLLFVALKRRSFVARYLISLALVLAFYFKICKHKLNLVNCIVVFILYLVNLRLLTSSTFITYDRIITDPSISHLLFSFSFSFHSISIHSLHCELTYSTNNFYRFLEL